MNEAVRVAALILAAGTSSRFGANKLLLPFGPATVVRATATNTLGSRARPVVVVTGHEQPAIARALDGLPLSFVHNLAYQAGEMLSSIKAGLTWLSQRDAPPDAALIALADQPLIPPAMFDRLITAFARGCGAIIAPRVGHAGPRGHPVLIERHLWPAVLALPAGGNVRDMLAAHPQAVTHLVVNTDVVLRDVDTPAAYEEAVQCLTRKPSNF